MSTTAPTAALTAYEELLLNLLPEQGRWTEEQYLPLTSQSNRLVEYTDGYLEPLPMPTKRLQAILRLLVLAFQTCLAPLGGAAYFAPLRLRIRPEKFRVPDLLLVKDVNDPRAQNQFWTRADLTLEVVSEDNPDRDLVDKRQDNAEAGVPEYWIVNPQTETITVLKLENGAYVEQGDFGRGMMATASTLPGFSVIVDTVFDAK